MPAGMHRPRMQRDGCHSHGVCCSVSRDDALVPVQSSSVESLTMDPGALFDDAMSEDQGLLEELGPVDDSSMPQLEDSPQHGPQGVASPTFQARFALVLFENFSRRLPETRDLVLPNTTPRCTARRRALRWRAGHVC